MRARLVCLLLLSGVMHFTVCHSQPAPPGKSRAKWHEKIVTPEGRKVELSRHGERYCMTWQQSSGPQTLCGGYFTTDVGHSWYPCVMDETKAYIVLHAGCGSPCWVGSFLPLYAGGKGQVISMYCGYNLEADVVASESSDSITITNLRTGKRKSVYPGPCASGFIDFCIDSGYFKGKHFYYRWARNMIGQPPLTKFRKLSLD